MDASAISLPQLLLWLLPGGANQFPNGFNFGCGPPPFTAHPIFRLIRVSKPGSRASRRRSSRNHTGPCLQAKKEFL